MTGSLSVVTIKAPRVYVGNPSKHLTLQEVLAKAPDIHVFDSKASISPGVKILKRKTPYAKPLTYFDKSFISGNGSKQSPFKPSAIAASAHNVIVALWLNSLDRYHQGPTPVFIKVNDWTLQVEAEGVRAEDGHFTKLLPN